MPPSVRIANRSRVRPARTNPCRFWPLATGHCSPASPLSLSPARVSETCYTARSSPYRTGLDPNAPHSHISPPTIPRPPPMSTRSELNVRNLPLANIAPGAAATNRKCSHLLSAAPPTRSGTKPAMQPMPSPPAPGSVSCHEKHVTDTVLRTFCTRMSSFCALSVQNRPRTDRDRILSRESMPISCHKDKGKFSKSGPFGQIYTIRYPIDTLPIPDFREIRSRFASHLDAFGPILDNSGPIFAHLRGATVKEAVVTKELNADFGARRRSRPRRGPLLAPMPDAFNLATVESIAEDPRSAEEKSSRRVLVP